MSTKISRKCATLIKKIKTGMTNGIVIVSDVKKQCDMDAIVDAINSVDPNSLTLISIDDTVLSNKGALVIAHILKQSTTLSGLCLRNNQLVETAVSAISRALAANKSLTHLAITPDNCASQQVLRDALVAALHINPDRDPESVWVVPNSHSNDNIYADLKAEAAALGHPCLFSLLSF